jgi:hypothetical protein
MANKQRWTTTPKSPKKPRFVSSPSHKRLTCEKQEALAKRMLDRQGLTNDERYWNNKLKENKKDYEKAKAAAHVSEEKLAVLTPAILLRSRLTVRLFSRRRPSFVLSAFRTRN